MIDILIVFLVVALGLAALARDRFIFSVLYLFIGAYAFGRWWSRKAIDSLAVTRVFDQHAFLGDKVAVRLTIHNTTRLPLLWVRFQEYLSFEISPSGTFRRVSSLGPRERLELRYSLEPRYRGYYAVGPLQAQTGDLFGLGGNNEIETPAEYLYVFPRIIPFKNTALPPSSPLGNLRSQQPIFEDPNRTIGKRDYIYGDSQRRIDWKSSASSGRLQVKLFEPSVDMQLMIVLNLNEQDYQTKFKIAATELAIVAAASIAYWSLERKIVTGMSINGLDGAHSDQSIEILPLNKGRAQLVKILEALARAKIGARMTCHEHLQNATPRLGWGTTLTLITGRVDDTLFHELYQLRGRGLNIVLIICGGIPDHRSVKIRAKYYGISFYHFVNEQDLDVWRY